MMSFIKTWAVLLGIGGILTLLWATTKVDHVTVGFIFIIFTKIFWMVTVSFSIFPAIFFYKPLKIFFDGQESKKEVVKYEEKQRQNRDYEEQRELDRKWKEMALEYKQLERIAHLQANIDQGKLDKLAEMKRELTDRKTSDLDTLKRQIEAMKRG
jgi:flagellar biosynthesis component FlhA